jgi:hypothetical protein
MCRSKHQEDLTDADCAFDVLCQSLDSPRKRSSSVNSRSRFASSRCTFCVSFLEGVFAFFLLRSTASASTATLNLFSNRLRTLMTCLQSFWVRLGHDPDFSDSDAPSKPPSPDVAGGDDLAFLPGELVVVPEPATD